MMLISILATAAAGTHADGQNPVEALAGQFGVNMPSLLAQILNFCLLAYILYHFALKPILATLDERQEKIADGLQYAEEMKVKLADAERRYAETIKSAAIEAQKMVEEARLSAKAHTERQLQEATHQAEELIKKAEAAIALERQKMLQEVRRDVAELVVDTTAAVLSKKLSSDERSSFAQSALQEIAS